MTAAWRAHAAKAWEWRARAAAALTRITLNQKDIQARVAAEGVTREDLAAQAKLVQQVAALGDRANTLAARVRERLREPRDDDAGAALQQLDERLNNARQTYPQQMLLSQIRYLSSMIGRADGRPGNHAYQRYTQLVEAVDDLERTLAEVGGK